MDKAFCADCYDILYSELDRDFCQGRGIQVGAWAHFY